MGVPARVAEWVRQALLHAGLAPQAQSLPHLIGGIMQALLTPLLLLVVLLQRCAVATPRLLMECDTGAWLPNLCCFCPVTLSWAETVTASVSQMSTGKEWLKTRCANGSGRAGIQT